MKKLRLFKEHILFLIFIVLTLSCSGVIDLNKKINRNIEFPEVTNTTIEEGQQAVPVTANISLTFNLPMNRVVTEKNIELTIGGVVSVSSKIEWVDDRTLAIIPDRPLEYDNLYTIKVGESIQSLSGFKSNSIFQTHFYTDIYDNQPPHILGTNIDDNTDDFYGDQNIVVFFNRSMEQSNTSTFFKLTKGGSADAISGTFEWVGANLVFKPADKLTPFTSYSITITTDAKALNNLFLSETFQQNFMAHGSLSVKGVFGNSGKYFLTRSYGITVYKGERVYVTDTFSSRIVIYKRTTEQIDSFVYYKSFGVEGSGDGELYEPYKLAINSEGKVYIADQKNSRIQVFDLEGNYLFKIGSDGSDDAEFITPNDLCVDPNDNLFVADTSNNRIQKFDKDGNFLTKWGVNGTGDGQFSNPRGICSDNSGDIFVSDTSNRRIQKFSNDGNFLTKWGTSGTGDGQFNLPNGLTFDGTNIIVADQNNHRFQVFSRGGALITKFGSRGVNELQFEYPRGISAWNGHYFIIDSDNRRVQIVKYDGILFNFISFMNTDYRFSTPGTFNMVTDCIFFDNKYFVIDAGSLPDTGNSRIQVFNSEGQFAYTWGSFGAGDLNFNRPSEICHDDSGNLYITDTYNHKIRKYTKDGEFIQSWGSTGKANGQFSQPRGIAFDPAGFIIVADSNNNRLQKFTLEGDHIQTVGLIDGVAGSAPLQFKIPRVVRIKGDTLFVADSDNCRIQILKLDDLSFIEQIDLTSVDRPEVLPSGLEIDDNGLIYFFDAKNSTINILDADYNYIYTYGGRGRSEGQFGTYATLNIINDDIFVSDTHNNRIQILEVRSDL